MVEPPDIVLAAIPALALAGPAVAAAARLLESTAGVGGVTDLPLTTAGLVATLLVIVVAMFVVPGSSTTDGPRSEQH